MPIDPAPGTARLRRARAGDVEHRFAGLREGYGYGVAWTDPA